MAQQSTITEMLTRTAVVEGRENNSSSSSSSSSSSNAIAGGEVVTGEVLAAAASVQYPTNAVVKPRRFVGKKHAATTGPVFTDLQEKKRPVIVTQIPQELLQDAELNADIAQLPSNYNFEIHKSVWRIKQIFFKSTTLAVNLSLFSDEDRHTKVHAIIMGDVTYAKAVGADFLIHYGHSCLVPIDATEGITVLYVFVDIKIDLLHFVETLKHNFDTGTKIALVSTIQFSSSLHTSRNLLLEAGYTVIVPQSKPLSPGEILGCTSPKLPTGTTDALVYLGDGRFHLESAMISNPAIKTYKYDPYSKVFSIEEYDHKTMQMNRKQAIEQASKAKKWGVILGTLGRQGSPKILDHIEARMKAKSIQYVVVLLSEIFPSKLALFKDIEAWVQIACPRLSIDWGTNFAKPLLNSYEAEVALEAVEWQNIYPMDYYSKDGGQWTNYSKK